MLQAHVVHAGNRHLYGREWERYLRIRHDIYVVEKRWRPPSADLRELDQFDTDKAVYIFGIEEGDIVASSRIVPTTEPTLVEEAFADMCGDAGAPSRPDWAEWTKTYVLPEWRAGGRRNMLTQICAATMEYLVEDGYAFAGGIQEIYFLPLWRHLRWRLEPLGEPREVAGAPAIVAYLECNDEAVASARRVLGIDHTLLVRRDGEQHHLANNHRGGM